MKKAAYSFYSALLVVLVLFSTNPVKANNETSCRGCIVYITNNSLADGKVGEPYHEVLIPDLGQGTITYSLVAGSLPPGLTLDESTGEIEGTPLAAGSETFTIQVQDESHNSSKELSINVLPGCSMTISTSSLPDAVTGSNYSAILQTTGGPGGMVMWSVTQGALPNGLYISSGWGLQGNIFTNVTGPYTFTVEASSGSCTASKELTINVTACDLQINNTSLPEATVGQMYFGNVSISGGTNITNGLDLTVIQGNLPTGMYTAGIGGIMGVPTTLGTYVFTLEAGKGSYCKTSKELSIAVIPCITFNTDTLPRATIGVPYDATISYSVNSGWGFTSVTAGSLPNGMLLEWDGRITGTPDTTGNFTFTCTVSGTCTASKSFSLNVADSCSMLVATLNDFAPVCSNEGIIELTGGFPLNGTYSGTGVINGKFYPTAGTQTITYTYTEANCTAEASKVLVVHTAPEVMLPDFITVCSNDGILPLSGGMPAGGIYTGIGVTNATFNTAVGTQDITYTYTDNNQCTESATKQVGVYTAPVVTLNDFAPVCTNVGTIDLNGGLPLGGTYTGSGVNNNKFNPVAGTQTITYTYSDGNCAASASKVLTVNTAPVVTLDNFSPVCNNVGEIQLTGGLPLGGIYAGVKVKSGSGLFDPVDGPQLISYTFIDNNQCAASASKTHPVNMAPSVNLSQFTAVCQNEGTISLNGGFPAGGVYSGTGVTNNTFNPSVGTQTITYTYTDNHQCTNTTTNTIQVKPSPAVSLDDFTPVCSNAGIVALDGASPLGGTFTGTGVTAGNFDLSVGTQTITYTYTNNEGCTATASKQFVVKDVKLTTLATFVPVCSNEEPFILTGGLPAGGMYSGTGVTQNKFDPSAGTQTITYTYYDDDNSCVSSDSKVIAVKPAPAVTLEEFTPVCSNTSPVTLYGGLPAGGQYTGGGVSNGQFDPSGGTQNIRYTYTSVNGCSASVIKPFVVTTATPVTLDDFMPACTGNGPVALRGGSPMGGTYSGTGVSNGMFDPSMGAQIITYTYRDNNGCESKQNKVISTLQSPEVSLTNFAPVCDNSTPIVLTGGYPTGGVYSGTGVHNGIFDPSVGTQSITYTVTANNGCASQSAKMQVVDICSGIEEVKGATINCFPNPASNMLTVNATDVNGNLNIRLVDLTGKVIATDEVNAQGSYQTTFDLSRLATGMYLVEIRNGNAFNTQKVVKQ